MPKTNLNKLILLIVIFAIPVMASWLLYHYHDKVTLKTLNHGIFIQPPIASQDLDQPNLTHLWQIVYYPKNVLDNTTEHNLFLLHQLRIALNKESHRVELILWTTSIDTPATLYDFQPMLFTAEQNKRLHTLFKQRTKPLMDTQNKIYLIDPIGNLFMYYPDTVNPMDIMKDLKRLLEVSQIG